MITSILFYGALILLIIFVMIPIAMIVIYCETGMKRIREGKDTI